MTSSVEAPDPPRDSRWRWLWRPRWILSHVLVVAGVVVMVNLGFWQLRRHGERSRHNELVSSRTQQPPLVLVAEPPDSSGSPDAEQMALEEVYSPTFDVGEYEWRLVVVEGRYLPEESALIRGRTMDGRPGFWVATPLVVGRNPESWVVVNRGWVPLIEEVDGSDVSWPTPGGVVSVKGRIRRGGSDARPAGESRATLASVDLSWFASRAGGRVAGFYVELTEQVPPQQDVLPVPLAEPELSAGPHLSYAIQWFVFASIASIGYPIVLVRLARAANRPVSHSNRERRP